MHLSTGTRTDICEQTLNYISMLQKRNKVLIDSADYFKEPIKRLQYLEDYKLNMDQNMMFMKEEKEQFILQKFDLERRLNELLELQNQQQTKQNESLNRFNKLQKKYLSKKQECESLQYRIKHAEDLSNMMEPPISHQSLVAEANAQSDPTDNDFINLQQQKMKGLETFNKKLENELNYLRQIVDSQQENQFSGNLEHFTQIQELFNKVEIENKFLKSQNKKITTQIESKEKLISHLENKITAIIIEKEEVIVNLKSELVIFKNSNEQNQQNFDQKMKYSEDEIEKQVHKKFKEKLQVQKSQFVDISSQKNEIQQQYDRLQNDYQIMEYEFNSFKDQKVVQEKDKESHLNDIQNKLVNINEFYDNQIKQLKERIHILENEFQIIQKQKEIQDVKLGYIRENIQSLMKQKQFIREDIEKNARNIIQESDSMRKNMLEYNQNKDYLISIQKALKLVQIIVDLGLYSLNNLLQIINFLKVEELNLLISNDNQIYQPQQIEYKLNNSLLSLDNTLEMKNIFLSKRSSDQTHIDPVSGLKIQKFIKEKNSNNFDFGHQNDGQIDQLVERNEEYYFHYCSLELSSILLKLLADFLYFSGACNEEDQLPIKLDQLIQIANEKSDSFIESEIFTKYLTEAKNQFEQKMQFFQEQQNNYQLQIDNLNQQLLRFKVESEEDIISGSGGEDESNINSISPMSKRKLSAQQQKSLLQNSQQRVSVISSPTNVDFIGLQIQDQAQLEQKRKEFRHRSVVVNQGFQNQLKKKDIQKNQSSSKKKNKKIQDINQDAIQQIENLKIELQEQKIKSKELALQLAQKIVILEEQIQNQQIQKDTNLQIIIKEQDLKDFEEIKKNELEKIGQGLQNKQNTFLLNLTELQDKIYSLESKLNDKSIKLKQKKIELERLKSDKIEFIQNKDNKNFEFENFKQNIQNFINLKNSNRCTFNLVFELNKTNSSMINEQIIIYYLNKCLKISKEKFRILQTDQFEIYLNENQQSKQSKFYNNYVSDNFDLTRIDNQALISQNISSKLTMKDKCQMAKLIIEIIDDEQNVIKYYEQLKLQINEGICILYDLQPLYLSLNLGSMGYLENIKIDQYKIIKKVGSQINNSEFIVSIYRHKQNPKLFYVLACNNFIGEEYILELNEDDISLLIEGQINILELNEPISLINLIIGNLNIITKDNLKILTCEYKIFFNNLFNNISVKENQSNNMNRSKILQNEQENTNIEKLQNMQQNDQILQIGNRKLINNDMTSQLYFQKEIQTDFINSHIYESFNQKYIQQIKIGTNLEFSLEIRQGQKSNYEILVFEEKNYKQKLSVCFIEDGNKVELNNLSQYTIYVNTLKLDESHVILFSAERTLNNGFLIKIHDLKDIISQEIFLIQKSNGQYSNQIKNIGQDLIMKEEFRNLVYDLTFNYPSNVNNTQQIQNTQQQYHFEGNQIVNDEQNSFENQQQQQQVYQFPNKKQKGKAQVLNQFTNLFLEANINQKQQIFDKNLEKGFLLYRNLYIVRCSFEGSEEIEQDSLISFYVKKDQISVEVFLYKDNQKMSIASQVNAQDLFGIDYITLNFSQKIELLDQMMQKLYVLSESKSYHLKVENDAIPIQQLIEKRKLALSSETGQLQTQLQQIEIEQKIIEIQNNKDQFLGDGKTYNINGYTLINNNVYEYKIYFMLKQEKESLEKISPKKKHSITRKVTLERQISNLEAFIEENTDFDSIYIEITDRNLQNYSTFLNEKQLTNLLIQNQDNPQIRQVLNKDKQILANLLLKDLQIDYENKILKIQNNQQSGTQQIEDFYLNIGGKFCQRIQNQKNEQLSQLIIKKLFINQEVEMSEFPYDIKIYEIILKESQELISYYLEIFCLNEPEIYYAYNYPIINNSCIFQPFQISFEIINLIEHPYKQEKNNLVDQSSIESSQKRNFQQLFQKYIDNSIIISIQEQKFPYCIQYVLIENSSKLQWSYKIDATNSTSQFQYNLSKENVLNQLTIDQCLLVLINQYHSEQLSLKEQKILQVQEVQTDIQNIEKDDSLFDEIIDENLRLILLIENQKLIVQIQSEDKNSYLENLHVINNEKQNLEFNIDLTNNLKIYSKLINQTLKGSSLFFVIEISQQLLQVIIYSFNDNNIEILIKYNLKSTTNMQDNENLANKSNFKFYETLIQSLYTTQSYNIIDSILKIQKDLIIKNQEVEKQNEFSQNYSLNMQRLYQSLIIEKQELILHRKTFYDESQEKLIIVSVSIDRNFLKQQQQYNETQNKNNNKNNYSFEEDEVKSFKITINEPEINIQNQFQISLDQCFLEEELIHLDSFSISSLKKFAKQLIEERAIIKRQNNKQEQSLGTYTLELNFIQSQQLTDELQSSLETEEIKRLLIDKKHEINKTDEILEMDEEEDEEDSGKKQLKNQRIQQSIIEEECSQEEEDSPMLPNNAKKFNKNNLQQLNISQNSNNEEYKTQQQQDDLIQELDESSMSVVLVKQLPKDEVLEIMEDYHNNQEQNPDLLRYVIRKKNTLDDIILEEQLLDENKIKEVLGLHTIDMRNQKDQILEMLADYILNTKNQEIQ